MHQSLSAMARSLVMVVLLLGTLTSVDAQITPSAAEIRGVQWLSNQVQADGSLSSEALSIATPVLARAELLQTLKLLAAVPAALSNSIAAEQDNNTEYLARMIISRATMGADVSLLINL